MLEPCRCTRGALGAHHRSVATVRAMTGYRVGHTSRTTVWIAAESGGVAPGRKGTRASVLRQDPGDGCRGSSIALRAAPAPRRALLRVSSPRTSTRQRDELQAALEVDASCPPSTWRRVRSGAGPARGTTNRGPGGGVADVRTGLPGGADERDGCEAAAAFWRPDATAPCAEMSATRRRRRSPRPVATSRRPRVAIVGERFGEPRTGRSRRCVPPTAQAAGIRPSVVTWSSRGHPSVRQFTSSSVAPRCQRGD